MPRWIACGMILGALATLTAGTPELPADFNKSRSPRPERCRPVEPVSSFEP